MHDLVFGRNRFSLVRGRALVLGYRFSSVRGRGLGSALTCFHDSGSGEATDMGRGSAIPRAAGMLTTPMPLTKPMPLTNLKLCL